MGGFPCCCNTVEPSTETYTQCTPCPDGKGPNGAVISLEGTTHGSNMYSGCTNICDDVNGSHVAPHKGDCFGFAYSTPCCTPFAVTTWRYYQSVGWYIYPEPAPPFNKWYAQVKLLSIVIFQVHAIVDQQIQFPDG